MKLLSLDGADNIVHIHEMQVDKSVRLVSGRSNSDQPEAGRRSDAVRHREALLDAGARVFARCGIDAPLEAVIEAAGVGRATLYRNFPDRVALVAALIDREIRAIESAAEQNAGPRALIAVLETLAERAHVGPTLADAWRLGEPIHSYLKEARERLGRALHRPLMDAKAAGLIRRDVKAADVLLIVRMIGGANRFSEAHDSMKLRKRALHLLMTGIGGPA